MRKKKLGATSILLMLTVVVFAVLVVSRRPADLFRQYKKTQYYDWEIQDAAMSRPFFPEGTSEYDGISFNAAGSQWRERECGSIDWPYMSSWQDQCNISAPFMDGLSYCWTHGRFIEDYYGYGAKSRIGQNQY